jgi:hypothetical protein
MSCALVTAMARQRRHHPADLKATAFKKHYVDKRPVSELFAAGYL